MTAMNLIQHSFERQRNTLWLVTGVLLAAALLFAANWESRRQERVRMDAFYGDVADLARTSEAIIADRLRDYDNILLVLRDSYTADLKRFNQNVGMLRSGPLADREVFVVLNDREGNVIFTDAPNGKLGVNMSGSAYFRYFADGSKDSFHISAPIFGRVTGRHSIPMVRPIYDKQGAFNGVVALSVRQDALASLGTRLELSGNTTVTVITEEGAVAARSRDLAKVQGTKISPELLAPMLKKEDGVFSSFAAPHGHEHVIAYRHIAGTPLIVYVESSADNVLRENSLQRTILMWGACFTSFVLMVMIIFYLKGRKVTVRLIETLRSSKKQEYETLTRTSLDGFYIVDSSGQILDINDPFCKMLGYTREELLCLSIKKITVEESPEKAAVNIHKVMETGSERLQSRWRCKEGNVIDVEISVQYLKKSNGRYFAFVRDITDRKRAEKALQESEERFRSFFETTADLACIADINGYFLQVNDSWERVLGYSKKELMQKPFIEFIHPEDSETTLQMIKEKLEKGETVISFNNRYLRKDGGVAELEWTSRPIPEKGITFAIARDITDRKLAEAALRESEEKNKALFEDGPIESMVVDREGRIIKFNKTFELSVEKGGRRLPAVGDRMYVDYASSHSTDMRTELMNSIHSKTAKTFNEMPYKGAFLNISIAPTREGAIISTIDVTDRKQAEETLRENEEKYRVLFEGINEAVFVHDLGEDGLPGRFLQVNDVACRRLGYTREELMSLTPRDITVLAEYERLADKRIGLASQGDILVETIHLTKDGKKIPVESNIRQFQYLGRQVVLSISRDISDRKRAEEERTILKERLQQADKMEAIGTLAGGIAHDFNNLLMGIQGHTSLTLLDLDPSHPHYDRLKSIEEQVQSGADLTRQLLGFARGGRYDVKPADMNDIIKKTSSMFGRTKKEISIHRKYGKDLRTVEVDRGQMEQVFMNLYVNAWQAMPRGGEIYLETEDVLWDDEQAVPYAVTPGEYVKITVSDTGTGMDEKTRERIFDPFFTTKEMGRGTGLGLATVYGIIKGHKGMIHVESKPGHGTTFTIYLPASEKEVVKEKTANGTIAKGTETILLVDDEKMVLEVNKELLESMGYRVYATGSGQEAIAVCMEKRNEINLVILDMIMPGISGGETFDRLREINPEIKVLLSSGYSINGEAQTIMDRGCNGFLQKPFRLANLSQKVREMLD